MCSDVMILIFLCDPRSVQLLSDNVTKLVSTELRVNTHTLKHCSCIVFYIFSYTDNIDIVCQRKIRMGKVGDGGWEVCDDPPYRPVKPCIVYSFG